jgi:hypothetical protein
MVITSPCSVRVRFHNFCEEAYGTILVSVPTPLLFVMTLICMSLPVVGRQRADASKYYTVKLH